MFLCFLISGSRPTCDLSATGIKCIRPTGQHSVEHPKSSARRHLPSVCLSSRIAQGSLSRPASNSNTQHSHDQVRVACGCSDDRLLLALQCPQCQLPASEPEQSELGPRPQVQNSNPGMGSTGLWKDMSMVYRIYQQCSGDNMSVCLKVKLLTGLEKAFRSAKSLSLMEGIQFVSSGGESERPKERPLAKRILKPSCREVWTPRSRS